MAVATYNEMIKGLHTFTYDIDHYVDSRNKHKEENSVAPKSSEKDAKESGNDSTSTKALKK